ncbi:MAG: aerobic carbon-monoxide dehydrogenase medium subunit [Candidatus Binatota bacterium]|nr:aerobic carbon-monoxide dehydrogenase medium subunit [Candidatus Binatota bacterium]
MKPGRFAYACPRTLDEALALAANGEAKCLAGGQSLMPMLNLRLARVEALIDLNRVPELARLERRDGILQVGATVRHRALEESPIARELQPLVPRAAREIGHLAIRNRGTIGGSLAHADPAAEWPLVAALLDAEVTLASAGGARKLPARDFFLGPLTTAASPSEIVTAITFPAAAAGTRFAFHKLCRRPGDFAIVAVAAAIRLDANGRCVAASLAVGGAHDVPLRARAAEGILTGSGGEIDAIRSAADAAARDCEPGSDVHGSAAFRRRMVTVLAARAIREASAPAA